VAPEVDRVVRPDFGVVRTYAFLINQAASFWRSHGSESGKPGDRRFWKGLLQGPGIRPAV